MKVRSDILRTYQTLHTWTGICAGLVLFIGFYAGSLTMFKPAIEAWATPPTHQLTQIEPQRYDALIQQAYAYSDKAKRSLTVNFEQDHSPITWYEQGGSRGINLGNTLTHATLDKNDQLQLQTTPRSELGTLIDQLHRTAGIVGKLGDEDLGVQILGIAAALYFIAIVSGVIFLLPTLVKTLFALRTNKGASRFWLDSHNLVGVLSLPFHFIIAWSVVIFAFHHPLYDGLQAIYGDKPLFAEGPAESNKQIYNIEQLPSIDTYREKVAELAPGYQLKSIEFSRLTSDAPTAALEVVTDNQLMRGGFSDYIYLHAFTMEVAYTSIMPPGENSYNTIVKSFFALHFGNYAGNTGRWIYFLLGLMGAFLFYTGNLLWLEKRRQKSPQQTRSSKFMAALTVAVCLGSIAGVAITLFANKWLYIMGTSINHGYLWCYYLVFFAAIIYSFSRGAALAAIHLQQLISFACAGIVMTTVVTALVPQWHIWSTFDTSTLIVDFVAVVFAIIFYVAAQKTKHRALNGEENSVWYIGKTPVAQPALNLAESK